MVFNVLMGNNDEHLKNNSFHYQNEQWFFAPAYDLTYSLNPLLHFKRQARALSIAGKRIDINLQDLLFITDKYTIKNPSGIIAEIENLKG